MKIFITGGFGALAYYLVRHIRQNDVNQEHKLGTVTMFPDEDFEFEHEFEPHKYDDVFNAFTMDDALQWADVIVHLAEDTNPQMYPTDAINHNVAFTAQLLTKAAGQGKRVVVPCWEEFKYNSSNRPWEASIRWRDELASMFHRGNAVINQVFLPRVISPLHHEYTYGNLVKRFYNAACRGAVAEVFPGEAESHAQWCWAGTAIEAIATEIRNRSRAPKSIPGTTAIAQSIGEYVAWKVGVEYIEYAKQKDRDTRKAVFDATSLDNTANDMTLRTAINNCIEVWDDNRSNT